MTRSTDASRWLLGAALVIVCAFATRAYVVQGQTDWKPITPVERGRQTMNTGTAPASSPAIRLIFEFDGDRVRVVQQTPVDMAAAALPLSSPDQPGVFVDVRDASSRTLARVNAPNALSSSIEAFPEGHDQQFSRSDVAKPSGAFTVIVPMPAGADHVTIVRVATNGGGASTTGLRTIDLVSFPLNPR